MFILTDVDVYCHFPVRESKRNWSFTFLFVWGEFLKIKEFKIIEPSLVYEWNLDKKLSCDVT